jgi:hypothetical protein
MAYAPVAFIAPYYRKFKNYWLKAYEPGTTTPKTMASDSTGATTFAKLQINNDGFIESSGGAITTPFIDGPYDAYLFPTETEADDNDTTNAERVADNLQGIGTAQIAETMQDYVAFEFDTVADAQIGLTIGGKTVVLAVNDVIRIKERSNALFDVISGTGTANGFDIIAHATLDLSFVLRIERPLDISTMGAKTSVLSAENNAAIDAWIAKGRSLTINAGTYQYDNSISQLNIPSNCRITGQALSALQFSSSSDDSVTITNKSNIVIDSVNFIGPGTGFGTGSDGLVIEGATNLTMVNCEVSQFNGIGVSMNNCIDSKITRNRCFNNSVYGIQDKNGSRNKITYNDLYNNGKTDAGTNAIGRGLVTWMVENGSYNFNKCFGNTEYGLRIYSQSGDANPTKDNIYMGNHCYDNGTSGNIEFYMFNESNLINGNIVTQNVITIDGFKSIIGMSVQGGDNTISDNQIKNSSNDQSGTAYQLFNCYQTTIRGGTVEAVGNAFSFSGSATFIPDEMTIDGVTALRVASFIPSITYFGAGAVGHTITNNKATHGGAGTDTGIALNIAWAEGQFELRGNRMDGFNKGFTLGNIAVQVSDNIAINSNTWGCEVTSEDNGRVELFGNDWDKAFPSSKCNMFQGRTETQGSRITSSNVSPASDSRKSIWQDGDFCHKTTVSVDGNGRIQTGWICTVSSTGSGDPGTWESVWSSAATWV